MLSSFDRLILNRSNIELVSWTEYLNLDMEALKNKFSLILLVSTIW